MGLAVVYVPLLVVLLNSFNSSHDVQLAAGGLHHSSGGGGARRTPGSATPSAPACSSGSGATALALVLGTMAAFAVARYRLFGREAVSFVLVLPIALPGIVTGIALNSAFSAGGVALGYLTVVVGHATFCIVVVYNNVLARLRRTGTTLEEASMDLGADTFADLPAGDLPAAAVGAARRRAAGVRAELRRDRRDRRSRRPPGLQTLPIWIFENLFRPNAGARRQRRRGRR